MTYQSQRRDQQTLSLLAIDHMPECPGCQELCPAGATVCAECGTHLFVRNTTAPARDHLDGASEPGQKEHIMPSVPGCTCGGRGLCTRCVLAEYDGDEVSLRMMNDALDATFAALAAPPRNVIPLDRYSKKVPS